ncbi:MAG: hypothetical protein FK734_00740 [Asgard group archaeon]|nr:hypothetical protein [Asgard group archaeon]
MQFTRIHLKNFIGCFLISLFCLTFFTTTLQIAAFVNNQPTRMNTDEKPTFNPYIATNCTKLGEYDDNYGLAYDINFYSSGRKDYALIANDIGGLLTVDITNPKEPSVVHQMFDGTYINTIAIAEHYVFLSGQGGDFIVIDIDDIDEPAVVYYNISIFNPFYEEITIIGDNLLCACSDGVYRYDISDRTTPIFIEKIFSGSFYMDMVIQNDLVFYVYDSNLICVNTSNNDFAVLSAYDMDYFILEMVIKNDLLFTSSLLGYLGVYDISNHSEPILINHILDSDLLFIDFLLIDETIGYILSAYTGIIIFDYSNPENITLIDRIDEPGQCPKFELYKKHLYVLDQIDGLEIYSTKVLEKPQLISRLLYGGESNAIAMKGDYIFIADGYNGLEILHLKNGYVLEHVITISTRIRCDRIFINGDYCYLISTYRGLLYTYDISNPKNPIYISTQELDFMGATYYNIIYLDIQNDTLYLGFRSSSETTIFIIDLTNKTNFLVQDIYILPYYFRDMLVVDNYLYCTGYFSLMIFDLTPENNLLSAAMISDYSYDIAFENNSLFIATYNGIMCFNVTDKTSPELIFATISIVGEDPTNLNRLFIHDDFLCISSAYVNRLYIINIASITNPYLEATYEPNNTRIIDVYFKDDLIFLACGLTDLSIIQLDRLITTPPIPLIIGSVSGSVVLIIAVPVIVLSAKKFKNRPKSIIEEPEIKPKIPRSVDEIETEVEISPEDFDNQEMFEFAQEIFDQDD